MLPPDFTETTSIEPQRSVYNESGIYVGPIGPRENQMGDPDELAYFDAINAERGFPTKYLEEYRNRATRASAE